jgi:hypothetical protein
VNQIWAVAGHRLMTPDNRPDFPCVSDLEIIGVVVLLGVDRLGARRISAGTAGVEPGTG